MKTPLLLWMTLTLLAIAAVPTLWTGQLQAAQLRERQARAAQLAADVASIRAMRSSVAPLGERPTGREEVTEHLVAALKAGGIPAKQIVSVLPQPPRRRPDSDLLEINHRVLLDAVELRGVVQACETLCRTHPELELTSLQLRAVPGSTTTWNVDLGISYGVFSPEPMRSVGEH